MGIEVLDDADVPAADAAPAVIADSGVATYDAVSLDAFLSDKERRVLDLSIDPFTEGMHRVHGDRRPRDRCSS